MSDGKKYLILGSGMMGRAIAHDLLKSTDTARVTLADREESRTESALRELDAGERAVGTHADAADAPRVLELMQDHDVAVGAASYAANRLLTRAAIATGTHFCDLGGNDAVTDAQFLHDEDAKRAGVRVMPACGIAPGSVAVLARHAIERVPGAHRVAIRVGGLPQEPQGPLKYALVFSANGLINEYVEPTEVIWGGKREMRASMSGLEFQEFPKPIGRLEAAFTSGGASTLARTYEGKVQYLDYKTLRWEGHWDAMHLLRDLGFLSSDRRLALAGSSVTLREFLERYLDASLPSGVPDLLVLRVSVKDASGRGLQFDLIDRKDPVTGHSAMQRTTGYSASIIAQMLASGEIAATGVLKHEEAVPPARYVEEWRKRGLVLEETAIAPA